jgi:predicted dehydrogenase
MMVEMLKGSVVGCRAGRGHALAMAESGEFAVTAVCDLDEELAAKVADQLGGGAVYADYAEMLERERPDVVAVATPNDSHARLTIAAAEAGVRGVCCEKPMATSMAEGRAILLG